MKGKEVVYCCTYYETKESEQKPKAAKTKNVRNRSYRSAFIFRLITKKTLLVFRNKAYYFLGMKGRSK